MIKYRDKGLSMIHHRRESELINPVFNFFKSEGYMNLASELQFYDYNIDIYGYSKETNKTVSIELKISNWRRAFEQSLVYQLCSDYTIIALPEKVIKRVELDLLNKEGIGLLSVRNDNSCDVILEPVLSKVLNEGYKRINVSLLNH